MRTERIRRYLEASNSKSQEQQFRVRMNEAGVNLQEGETVDEFIHRFGFPFSLHPVGERNDN